MRRARGYLSDASSEQRAEKEGCRMLRRKKKTCQEGVHGKGRGEDSAFDVLVWRLSLAMWLWLASQGWTAEVEDSTLDAVKETL